VGSRGEDRIRLQIGTTHIAEKGASSVNVRNTFTEVENEIKRRDNREIGSGTVGELSINKAVRRGKS